MEIQFQENKIPCLHPVKSQTQSQEQTQELRLNDGAPDVGRVLGAWGQVVVRGKEWHSDSTSVNCGVMAWVLYAPEDGSQAQCVETWIPVSLKWDIPDQGRDGTITCQCHLRSVDARVLSGRKMMVRATVCATAQMYVEGETCSYTPADVPADVQLLEKTYPVCLAREAGEKAFMFDEELTLPPSAPALEKPVRWNLQMEVTDQKVLGDKAVFRGTGLLHLLYRTQEGALSSWDFEIPFSQYTELEYAYGDQAQVQVIPLVTALETETADQGRLRLKAGLSGQYVIYDTQEIPVVEDAYSPDREVKIQTQPIFLPAVLSRQSQPVRAEQTVPYGSSRVADIAFYPGCGRTQNRGDEVQMELPGLFQMLYYDSEGVLQPATAQWQWEKAEKLPEDGTVTMWCAAVGSPLASSAGETTVMQADCVVTAVTAAKKEMPMVTGLGLGESSPKDPARPSLILQRAGKENLWSVAKRNSTTVSAIREANDLQDEPDPDRILLIPIM